MAEISEFKAIATNTPFPYVTEDQLIFTGKILCVHVIPSDDVAAIGKLLATATNTPLPYVTEYQPTFAGKVLCVHVIPSGDVAAIFEP